LTGALQTVFTTMIATILQLEAPPVLRGRIMGLYAITLIGLPGLGALGAGVLARTISAPRTVALGAALTVVAVVAAIPALERARRPS
jgi:hypothetical protein